MLEKLIEKQDLIKLVDTYSISTKIGSRVFDSTGKEIYSHPGQEDPCSFCKLIREFEQGQEDCQQSYLYGGLQAEKLSEYYIYFCPYGLVNWAVPVLEDNKMTYFLSGGPVLMHESDDSLIEDIIQQNPLLKHRFNDLKVSLNEIEVISTGRVRYLADLLLRLAKNLMIENIARLEKQQEINVINARVAETIHALKRGEVALSNSIYPFEKENELILEVKHGNKQQAGEILNEILGFIYFQSGGKFAIVKSKAIELMVVLARAAIEANADLEIIFGLEYMYLEHIDGVNDIDELSEWLARVLDRFIDCTFSIRSVKNKDIIYKAMSFIRENYDRNISLDEVASEIGLNSSYFSKLFKDEMKLNYTDYLNRIRIEASKKLLKDGYSLVDAAQEVGFNDQSYFSKVFKKIEGISPGKWRG
jgi:two-component system, response regulator YesN